MELPIILILAAVSLTFFIKLVRFKKAVEKEFDNYEEKLEEEVSKRKEAESEYQSQLHLLKSSQNRTGDKNPSSASGADSKAVESLLFEIENLHKEKDEELKLRLEAEKQIELAIQKTSDVQQRIEDWKNLQEANLKDATDAIMKVGNDLYQRLIKSHKVETEEMQNRINQTINNISGYLEKIVSQTQFLTNNNIDSKQAVKTAISINRDSKFDHKDHHSTLEEVLQSAGLKPGSNYYPQELIPEDIRKSIPCESFVILNEHECLVIDTKSLKFFGELHENKSKNDPDSISIFQKKIERYLSYLSNPKYKSNIVNYFSSHSLIPKEINTYLIMLVPTEKEISEFLSLGEVYQNLLKDNKISLHSLQTLSDFILEA